MEENYDKIEDLDRKVFVIMEQQQYERKEREKTQREEAFRANAKEAPNHGDEKDESKEKIADGINSF